MSKRKYPLSMTIMGTVIFLVQTWYALIFAVILFIASLIFPDFPMFIIITLIGAWVLVAIIRQLISQRELLRMNPNKEAAELLDKMFADNGKGYKNVTDTVYEEIHKQVDARDESE